MVCFIASSTGGALSYCGWERSGFIGYTKWTNEKTVVPHENKRCAFEMNPELFDSV